MIVPECTQAQHEFFISLGRSMAHRGIGPYRASHVRFSALGLCEMMMLSPNNVHAVCGIVSGLCRSGYIQRVNDKQWALSQAGLSFFYHTMGLRDPWE